MSADVVYVFIIGFFIAGCSTVNQNRPASQRVGPIHQKILMMAPDLEKFSMKGPFDVTEKTDREISVDLETTVVIDHFGAVAQDRMPIILISHGNYSGRKAHRIQARHLASWGFHVVVCEFPNRDEWLENGRRLFQLASLVYRFPGLLGVGADKDRLLMVGHSFGGSAALMALSEGAPAVGAVLLDPAVVHKSVIRAMREVDLPIALLGADPTVFNTRGRSRFWKAISGELIEASISKATHDDAQGPSMFSSSALGVDPFTSENRQMIFRSMLVAASIGITMSGSLDFPRTLFIRELSEGFLKDVKYRDRKVGAIAK